MGRHEDGRIVEHSHANWLSQQSESIELDIEAQTAKPQDEPKEESETEDFILDFQFNNGLQVGNSIIHMIGHSSAGKVVIKSQDDEPKD